MVAAGVVPDSEDAEASLRDVLAAALDANRELARLAAELREENERLRAENAVPAMPPAGRVPGPAGGGSAARGHGRGGGITRTCPGSRCSGIFPGAGTAARNAGSRSRRWAITGPGSSWTGR